jgi:hypothetical protein
VARAPEKAVRLAQGKPATWMPLSELAGAALPSPIKRLLLSLESDAGKKRGNHR